MTGINKGVKVTVLNCDFEGKFIFYTKWGNGSTVRTGVPLLLVTYLTNNYLKLYSFLFWE